MDKKEQAEQVELDQDFLGIGAFLAGVTALTGAFVGLRGWEIML